MVVSLYGVSFSVNAGECVCVAGTNGSGKSTLLPVIAGAKPDAGSVTVDGEAQTYGGGTQRTGLVFHEPNDQLFMLAVWEDIAFGILKRGVSLETARASVEATALANS
jgi:energy-coupling factor transporter ATP-binding protein EcfA2